MTASVPTARILPSKICTSSTTWLRTSAGARTVPSSSSRSTADARVELADLHDVDELEELLDDLLERRRVDVDHDREPAEAVVLGGGDGEGVDVVAPPGEQRRHPGQHAGLVLDEHRQDVWCGLVSAVHAHRRRSLSWTGVEHEVVVADAGRHHREHLLAGVDAELQHDRPVVDLVGLVDGRLDLVGSLHPDARCSPSPRPTSRSRAGRATGTPRCSARRRTSPATGAPCPGRSCSGWRP